MCLQGEDSELFIGSYNSYQRAIQYQQLEKEQFGASQPPGFSHAVQLLLPLEQREVSEPLSQTEDACIPDLLWQA